MSGYWAALLVLSPPQKFCNCDIRKCVALKVNCETARCELKKRRSVTAAPMTSSEFTPDINGYPGRATYIRFVYYMIVFVDGYKF